MIISARTCFKIDEEGWDKYVQWLKLPHIEEVRTIDATINKYVDDCGNINCDSDNMYAALETLPKINKTNQYYLLAIDESEKSMVDVKKDKRVRFLGYDLADSTRTSSLLNCGPWEGRLIPIKEKINSYGLLDLNDAKLAQIVLPEVWGKNEPHAFVNIYGLFEIL